MLSRWGWPAWTANSVVVKASCFSPSGPALYSGITERWTACATGGSAAACRATWDAARASPLSLVWTSATSDIRTAARIPAPASAFSPNFLAAASPNSCRDLAPNDEVVADAVEGRLQADVRLVQETVDRPGQAGSRGDQRGHEQEHVRTRHGGQPLDLAEERLLAERVVGDDEDAALRRWAQVRGGHLHRQLEAAELAHVQLCEPHRESAEYDRKHRESQPRRSEGGGERDWEQNE